MFSPDSEHVCPVCGETVLAFEQQDETWHHSDFFQYATYLHARVPLVTCPCCGVITAERPWSRDGSKFILKTVDANDQPLELSLFLDGSVIPLVNRKPINFLPERVFDSTTMSASTSPSCSIARKRPVRPMPACTSSSMNNAPCS